MAEGPGSAVLFIDFQRRGYPLWHDESPRRFDGRTWGAFRIDCGGLEVLAAVDVNPRELAPLLCRARENYSIICADLSEAAPPQCSRALGASEAIFLVSGDARRSLEGVCEKMEWLKSLECEDHCALLLSHESGAVSAADAEEITGVPVCGYVDGAAQIAQLGRWLAANVGLPEPRVAAVA